MPPKSKTQEITLQEGSKYEGQYYLNSDVPVRQGHGKFIEALVLQDPLDCPGFEPLEQNPEIMQIFDGEWENDHFTKGIITFPNGARYEGEVDEKGQYSKGKYYFKNGECWDGPFVDCKMTGEGVLTDKAGVKWKGIMNENYAESMIRIEDVK